MICISCMNARDVADKEKVKRTWSLPPRLEIKLQRCSSGIVGVPSVTLFTARAGFRIWSVRVWDLVEGWRILFGWWWWMAIWKKTHHHLSLFPLEIFIDSDCILMLRQSFLASNTFCSCNLEIIHHVFNTKYWQKTGKILIKCSSRCKVKVYDKNFYQS